MALPVTALRETFRNYVERTVAYVEYKTNGSTMRTGVSEVTLDDDGVISIWVGIDLPERRSVISDIKIYTYAGELWMSVGDDIITDDSDMYWIYCGFSIQVDVA